MEKIINTPKGQISIKLDQKYQLFSLVGLNDDQLQPFYKLFNVDNISGLVKLMKTNDIIVSEDILNNNKIWDWLDKSADEIEKLMAEKGIWFPGMTKYLAIKVLLQAHSIVTDCKVNSNSNSNNNNDQRNNITTGSHYEPLPPKDFSISTKRDGLRLLLLKSLDTTMLKSFDSIDLQTMFDYYDNCCFNHEISEMAKTKGRIIMFDTNLNSVHKVGEHCYDSSNKTHTIRISPKSICNLFNNGETSLKSNGLIITDRLGALINVFEHELVHLYCSLKGYTRKISSGEGKMYYSPHGKLFQELVFRFFGHTDFRHDFNNGDTTGQMDKNDMTVGMAIYFDNKDKRYYGKITKINPKTCKIDTEKDGTYTVSHNMIRQSDRDVTVVFKNDNKQNNKSKYSLGMVVKFKTRSGYVEGKIIKTNPKRARVSTTGGTYDVPYENLI